MHPGTLAGLCVSSHRILTEEGLCDTWVMIGPRLLVYFKSLRCVGVYMLWYTVVVVN